MWGTLESGMQNNSFRGHKNSVPDENVEGGIVNTVCVCDYVCVLCLHVTVSMSGFEYYGIVKQWFWYTSTCLSLSHSLPLSCFCP